MAVKDNAGAAGGVEVGDEVGDGNAEAGAEAGAGNGADGGVRGIGCGEDCCGFAESHTATALLVTTRGSETAAIVRTRRLQTAGGARSGFRRSALSSMLTMPACDSPLHTHLHTESSVDCAVEWCGVRDRRPAA